MKSRQFTVDPAKLKKFLNVMLQAPKLRVPDAMKLALVERNDYATYTMDDIPPLPDYKVILPKGKFNGLRTHYNIRTDPDLGIGFAALRRAACGCGLCKE